MIEMRDVRDELWEIVSSLYRVENRVASLADRVAPQARHMWESDRPRTVVAHLHAALQIVRGDYLAEAVLGRNPNPQQITHLRLRPAKRTKAR